MTVTIIRVELVLEIPRRCANQMKGKPCAPVNDRTQPFNSFSRQCRVGHNSRSTNVRGNGIASTGLFERPESRGEEMMTNASYHAE